MAVPPTGRRETRSFGSGATIGAVVISRRFPAPITEVWAAVTESRRLSRWIGEWHGDATSGEVSFRMTAEGEDATPELVTISACERPRHLLARFGTDADLDHSWRWEIDLVADGQATVLTFAQAAEGMYPMADIGPGWEYYLDRLGADLSGLDPNAVDFGRDYYPSMSEYYRML